MVNEYVLNEVLTRSNSHGTAAESEKTAITATWTSNQSVDGATGSDTPSDESSEGSGAVGREKWNRNVEFLLSCVALSVGFGNVWRFPNTAMSNGGGAFLLPYLIVLFIVGRPIYYLEMVMGQFSSRGCVKVFDVVPLMRGIGVGQTLTMALILGFYAAILAISVRYFVVSFAGTLPWARCLPEWAGCVDSEFKGRVWNASLRPSAEFYFHKSVLHSQSTSEHGLGLPDWKLALCLLFCWLCITVILIRGIRSSGKASYFLAIFPYIILLVLLVRTCTLEGASDGILYLLKPQWNALFKPQVWYAAVTQCFFSLTISLGAIVVFASYNNFSNNIYRDAMIISCLDTFTSIISAIIVFGIVGNIAHVTGSSMTTIKMDGPELTFVTYPDAIAKFDAAQNVFAVLFFFMFFLLGLGSNTGIVTTIVAAVKDRFPQLANWKLVSAISIYGFACGLVYITPGGMDVLGVVNMYGVEMTVITLAILEVVTFCWLYGVARICQDIKFMLGRATGVFWRLCWAFVTLAIMLTIWVLSFITSESLTVPPGLIVFGWCLFVLVVVQVPLWAGFAVSKRPEDGVMGKIVAACRPTPDWGPEDATLRMQYQTELARWTQNKATRARGARKNVFQKILTALEL